MRPLILDDETLNAKFLKGSSIVIEPSLFVVTPLKVGEIIDYGVDRYFSQTQILTLKQTTIIKMHKEVGHELKEVDVYLYVCASMLESAEFLQDFKKAFRTFTGESIDVIVINEEPTMYIGNLAEKRLMDKEIFLYFQNIIRAINGIELEAELTAAEAGMRGKFEEARRMREEAKRNKELSFNHIDEGICDLISTYAVVSGRELSEVFELPYYALLEQMQRTVKYKHHCDITLAQLIHGPKGIQNKEDYTGAIRPYVKE